MSDKIIVFEEVYNYSRFLIVWYRINGYHVYYFRLNIFCKDKHWVKRYIEKEKLIKIDSKYDIISFLIGMYPNPAYDNIEKIAKIVLKEDSIVSILLKLYDDEGIYELFKKNLAAKLERFYYLNFIIRSLDKIFIDKRVYFVPTLHKDHYRIDSIGADDYFNFLDIIHKSEAFFYENINMVFPLWFRLITKLHNLRTFLIINFKITSFLILSIFKFLTRGIIKKTDKKKAYKFGIMIVVPEGQFDNKTRKVDFLIDGESIKKEEVLFISLKTLLPQSRGYLMRNNLAFADGLLLLESSSAHKVILPTLKLLFKTIAYRHKMHIIESALLSLAYYLIWSGFKERYRISNLITYCDYSRHSIARNLLLSKDATTTWYYLDTNNFTPYYIPYENGDSFNKRSSNYLGYLNYDYLLTWSDEISAYFKKHHQNIKYYRNIGCLWAEHIKEIENGKIKTDLKEKLYKAGFKDSHKLVAIFDTSHLYNSLAPYEDSIDFLRGILQLLEEIPDIFIVFKEKKARSFVARYSRELIKLFESMEESPRCYLPGNTVSPSETIAFSELTISAPFTSPTFEAVSARKKGIYYDASGKRRGTYYDAIPGLVCHNYDELRVRVKELLFEISAKEYDIYLDRYIKKQIEFYLDGKAISRFREMLVNEN